MTLFQFLISAYFSLIIKLCYVHIHFFQYEIHNILQHCNWQFSRIKFEHFFPMIILGFESKIEFMNKNVWTGNHLCLLAAECFDSLGDWLLPQKNRHVFFFSKCIVTWDKVELMTFSPHFLFSPSFNILHNWSPVQSICRCLPQERELFFCRGPFPSYWGSTSAAVPEEHPPLCGSHLHFLSFLPLSALRSKSLNSAPLSYASTFHSLCNTIRV